MGKKNFFSSGTTVSNVDLASLIMRVVSGSFMIYGHGWGKFQKFFSDQAIEFMDPFGISATATLGLVVFAEVICSALVVLGLMTRIAIIPLMITMAYAGFVVHGADEFRSKELAFFYLVTYFVILLIGPGKHSLDRMIRKRRSTL